MKFTDIENEDQLWDFMTEPSASLIESVAKIDGSMVVLGGSGKMGKELVGLIRRADEAHGIKREITVASTFSNPASTDLVDFREITALDLFSGTGAISFELVSRGCNEVSAVDQNRQCVEWIRNATKNFQIENLQIRQADSFRFMTQNPQKYHLIFADPPYKLKNIDQIPALIFKNKLLNKNGLLILEHDRNWDFTKSSNFIQHRNYGNVNFSLFQN